MQDAVTASTGGSTFTPGQSSKLGRALGTPRIDQELQTASEPAARRRSTRGSRAATPARTQLYKQVAAATPKDLLVLQLLANSAYQSRDNQTAIDASRRVIKLAPGTQEVRQARQLIQLIKAQAAAQPSG